MKITYLIRCFYSKLVRLKAKEKPVLSFGQVLFLFQIGSIKSLDTLLQRIIYLLVSIPNWFD